MKISDYESTGESVYEEFAKLVRSLLKKAIAKSKGLPRPQSTQSRAKSVDSLTLKLEDRKLLDSERIEDEIKDLAGVRLIFYTDTDVDTLLQSRLIPDNFSVQWGETKVHHPTDENDQQRYKAFHYTVSLSERHLELEKYKKFNGLRCEIQIQAILNHAWAETTHDMIYKPRKSPGFGTKAREQLEARMKKTMDDYLRATGCEFQKVQKDHEHLMQGKTTTTANVEISIIRIYTEAEMALGRD